MSHSIEIQLESDYLMALKAVLKFAAINDARYMINGIYHQVEDNRLRLVGTNGFMLGVLDMQVVNHGRADFAFCMPTDSVKILTKALSAKSDSQVVIRYDDMDHQWFVESDNVTVEVNALDGIYPNVERLFPTAEDVGKNALLVGPQVGLSAGNLKLIMEAASLINKTGFVATCCNGHDQSTLFQIEPTKGKYLFNMNCICMPMKSKEEQLAAENFTLNALDIYDDIIDEDKEVKKSA